MLAVQSLSLWLAALAVPPDASELDEGVLVVHDREGEEGEAMAVPAHVESSQPAVTGGLTGRDGARPRRRRGSRANY